MCPMMPNKGKGGCSCGWDDCLGLCSFHQEPLDEDVLTKAPRGSLASMIDSFGFDSVTLPMEIVSNDTLNKVKGEEAKLEDNDAMASVEVRDQKANVGVGNQVAARTSASEVAKAPEALQGPETEKKRLKEKKRRGDINKGFQELTKIIFVIDPGLKERARMNSSGMMPLTDECRLLGRVELVNSAVTTMARLYKDNEVHKMLIAHLTSASDETVPQEPLDTSALCLPNVIVSSLSYDKEDALENEKADKDAHTLSRSEIKRNREKKRRKDIRKGLDKLSQMILVIDPQLKAAAEEWAKNLQANGSTSNIKGKRLLCHAELVTSVVATLSRIHSENEIHKVIIAKLARARGTPSVSLPMNPVSTSPCDMAMDDMNHVLGNDAARTNPLWDAAMQSPQEATSSDSSIEPYSLREILLDVPFFEDGPPMKRLKT